MTAPATTHDRPRPEPREDHEAALAALGDRVREDLAATDPRTSWSDPEDADVAVAIAGGGQAGLATAFALRRAGVGSVTVIDDQPAHRVGCWDDYARMHTLRSPKHMRGIELDCPSLHVQRWFEARYGEDAWESIDLVPRLDWHDYLLWYRQVLELPVRHDTRVEGVSAPAADGGPFRLTLSDGTELTARRVVFALGLDGGGARTMPGFVAALPEHVRAHTADPIDFAALAGKRVAVLGGGASGFDNAACALEAGAADVQVHMRRTEVPNENPLRWMEFPGMQDHFADLDDEDRWAFGVFNGGLPQPPTQASIWRCMEHANFELVMGSPWQSVEWVPAEGAGAPEGSGDDAEGDGFVRIVTAGGREVEADYVIAATGYRVDLSARPELAEFVDDIALWSDVHDWAKGAMAACPYLGDGFQFTPKEGAPGYIGRLFHLSTGARASMGVAGNQLSGIHAGVRRVARRVAADITREKWSGLYASFQDFHHVEITSVAPHAEGDAPYPSGPRY